MGSTYLSPWLGVVHGRGWGLALEEKILEYSAGFVPWFHFKTTPTEEHPSSHPFWL